MRWPFKRKGRHKQPEESPEEEIAERSVVRQEIVERRIPPPEPLPEPEKDLSPKLRKLGRHRCTYCGVGYPSEKLYAEDVCNRTGHPHGSELHLLKTEQLRLMRL